MNDENWEQILEDMQDSIRLDVTAGFANTDEIIENVMDIFSDEDINPQELRALAHRLTRDVLLEHLHGQQHWPDTTDCDLLDDAFEELEQRGIVARHNFVCCGTCGSTEIWTEIEQAEENGRDVRGYTYYHLQDTESAIDGDGLYLYYGSVEEGEDAALAIADEVEEMLNKHGLATTWDGNWDSRIIVEMEWKRRRPVEVTSSN